VYVEGYLRISQNKYQLLDISSEKSHLTNFSVNWSKEEDTEDSYLLLSDFLAFLEGNQIKSASVLKNEINEVISQTLYSAELLTNSGDQRCFELFGFDIILDGDLKPWLLEVNMSPACKERGILNSILE
jgi:tubulin monoglycylase TTLL3/8